MLEDNVIRVGNKPLMNYKARDRAISRAVDVVEVTRNRFMRDVQVVGIKICTEELQNERGEKVNVSSMETNQLRGMGNPSQLHSHKTF